MNINKISAIICAALLLSCDKNGNNPTVDDPNNDVVVTEGNIAEHAFTRGDVAPLMVALSEQEGNVFKSGYAFVTGLFEKAVSQADAGNVCISPLSIQTILGILSNGLKVDYANSMMEIMVGQGTEVQDMNSGYGKLAQSLEATNCVKLSNALWLQEGNKFNDDFLAIGRGTYHSTIKNLDFRSAPQSAMDTICQWAYDNSYGRLNKLGLKELGSNTVMVLGNLIWFSSAWISPFDTTQTTVGEFTLDDGSVKEVDMMCKTEYMDYKVLDKYRVVSLPFENRSFRMDLFVPNDGYTLDEVIPEIDWEVSPEIGKVALQIPRFTIDFNSDVRALLEDCGMSELFNVGVFDRMTDQDNDAHIDELKQNILIKVQEGGVEAVAATVATYVGRSESYDFKIDKPFVFTIRDNAVGSFLFMGRINSID